MKFFLFSIFYFFSYFTFAQKGNGQSFYQTVPKSFTPVNDYAGMFTADERASLTKKIQQYGDTSTNVIVIITQNTLKDANTGEVYQLEEAAKHYFNNWGIGLKDKNNGVLFFIVKNDRKIRITTGKGIVNVLNDNQCQDIVDEIIVPNFKQTNYYNGIDKAVDKVMQILSPEMYGGTNAVAEPSNNLPPPSSQSYTYDPNTSNNESSPLPFIIFIIIVMVIVLGIVRLFRSNNSNSTVYNADGFSTPSSTRGRGLMWFLSGIFFSNLFNNRHSSNRNYNSSNNSNYNNNDSYSSSSSDSFSSSSESGSSFGGGSSDGGGASGSW